MVTYSIPKFLTYLYPVVKLKKSGEYHFCSKIHESRGGINSVVKLKKSGFLSKIHESRGLKIRTTL